MNILHILGSLNIGGAENLVSNLMEIAAKRDSANRYSIVYMHHSDKERVELFSKSTDTAFIECKKGIKGTYKFINALRTYIKTKNIEIIHCHNNVDAYWAYLASLKTSVKKIILTVHGLNLNFKFLKNKFKIYPYADRFICKKLSITYVSGVTSDYYKNTYNYKELEGDIIYNGVAFKNPDAEDNSLTKEKWMQTGKPVFGMVGNFNTPVRLQIEICKALQILKNRYRGTLPFTFIFAGAQNAQFPHLYNNCVTLCKEMDALDKEIFFLGARRDVPQILHSINGYVYCSSGDSFGLSVIEAIGANLPTICSNIATFKEILYNGKLGYLVNNTPEEIADAIQMLYTNLTNKKEPLLDGVLNVAPVIVKENYSLEKCLNCFEAKYRE
ncbi:MAG: glycosyltransferase family 4 protein [Bacteroidia bacterium]|nr:glycosyltransferase family 4 protein [Bacteroidia bacterium]